MGKSTINLAKELLEKIETKNFDRICIRIKNDAKREKLHINYQWNTVQ